MDNCFLCGRTDERLDVHHIFGGPNRALSDKYGLTVKLCHSRCHIYGNKAVHRNRQTMQELHEYGQRKWMKDYNGSIEDFRKIFGKNYIDEDEQ